MRLDQAFLDQYQQHELRTHGRKNGFVTKGQQARLEHWLPIIGLPRDAMLTSDDTDLTKRAAPWVLEIGFGNGDFLVHMAQTHPEWRLIGIEIYLPSVAKAVGRLEDAEVIDRCRISQLPAQFVLEQQIPEGFLHGIVINHPDPWPKLRHHKRRLIQPEFARLLVSRLELGGFIHLASDKPDLAEWMRDILNATPGLHNEGVEDGFVPRDDARPSTKFEQRGLCEGRASQFLQYRK
ncbi:MAG: tRNA (guanosine(46)-N7)-methyltransferase TrmB [Mariprofundales bacterium]|nr:tRNA (guanosine(46)-N7)-methyltransferase TrmB [Mariprofundales bacterium]